MLKNIFLVLTLLSIAFSPILAQKREKNFPAEIGMVSYTYRNSFAKDVAKTLDTIRALGIRDMEFSNLFGKKPEELRKLLDERNMKCVIEAANSEWFGLVLDIGSYRTNEPYKEIESTASYAVNWQIKEKIFVNGREVIPDLAKIMRIVKASGYRGYLPIETLGAEDPKVKVPLFLAQVRKALA